MACNIKRPDAQELWDRMASDFSLEVLGGAEIIPESNEWYVLSVNFALAEQFQSTAEIMWRERDPRYACCENLQKIAAENGVFPRPATKAQGFVKLTGAAGTELNNDIVVEFDGKKYRPSGQVPLKMAAEGWVAVRVQAEIAGSDGNEASGKGVLITPIQGIDAEVSAYGTAFCGGAEPEECEEFRTRYLERMAFSNHTDMKWFKNKILEYPCVTSVCDRGENCCETDENGKAICSDFIEVHAFFDGTFDCGLPPQCVLDDMNDWLFGTPRGSGTGQAPFGVCGEVIFVQGGYINIRLDGFACYSEEQRNEVETRIREFIDGLCPSVNLSARSLELIAAQVVGNTDSFNIVIDIIDDGKSHEGLSLNMCGDLEVGCDWKPCLRNIEFVNLRVSKTGCM